MPEAPANPRTGLEFARGEDAESRGAERVLLVLDQNLNCHNVRKKSPDLPPAALTEPPGMKWV